YPPFFRLVKIDVKHREQQLAQEAALRLAAALRQELGHRVLGPEVPVVGRIRNQYIYSILLKVERTGTSIAKVKHLLSAILVDFNAQKINKGIRLQVDVDPY